MPQKELTMLPLKIHRQVITAVVMLSVTLLAVAVQQVHAADPITTPGNHDINITVGDMDRRFVVHVPPQYDGSAAVPVVVMLHGAGGDSENVQRQTGWDQKADEVGFLAVFGNATPTFPNIPENVFTN